VYSRLNCIMPSSLLQNLLDLSRARYSGECSQHCQQCTDNHLCCQCTLISRIDCVTVVYNHTRYHRTSIYQVVTSQQCTGCSHCRKTVKSEITAMFSSQINTDREGSGEQYQQAVSFWIKWEFAFYAPDKDLYIAGAFNQIDKPAKPFNLCSKLSMQFIKLCVSS
jgi:hypothetical protein